MGLRIALLSGPIRVGSVGSEPTTPRLGRRERALLALLALHHGDPVTVDRLIDQVWPEDPPNSAGNALQVYVARIRSALGREAIRSVGAGYALDVAPLDVDVVEFERLAERGERALRAGRAAEASDLLRRALSLWPDGADVEGTELPAVQAEAVRLVERRLATRENQIEAELALGRGPSLVADLQLLAAQHPLRERVQGALIRALFQAGRQADALASYSAYRRESLAELGLEPGPALVKLQRSILAGGADLAPLASPGAPLVRTLGSASSVPTPLNVLVGRDADVSALTAWLPTAEQRLITLVGPGGAGKTRLAVEVANRLIPDFPDGIYFVPLASITSADVMWTSIAEVMDLPVEGRSPPDLFGHVAARTALIVLDNLEQLRSAGSVVSELLARAPGITVLATSRRPLHIVGEREHAVATLDLPGGPGLESAQQSAAVQLFVQQARLVRADFRLTAANVADVSTLCRGLDGLPLAIELVAARSKLLTPAALVARLDEVMRLPARQEDRPTRHQSLHAALTWSYDLLSADAQALFRCLGVFAGGADLAAVTTVAGSRLGSAAPVIDRIDELVDANLLQASADPAGEPRVQMLETLRAYALHEIGSPDLTPLRRDHARHYREVARGLRGHLSEGEDRFLAGRQVFQLELDNFRAALRWSLDRDDSADDERLRLGLQLCAELGRWWQHCGYLDEARRWLEQALAGCGDQDTPEQANCLFWLAEFLLLRGDLAGAAGYAVRNVEMLRRLGNDDRLGPALIRLAQVELASGDRAAARAALEEVLAGPLERPRDATLANGLSYLADLEAAEGHHERSLELQEAAATLHVELGDQYNALTDRQGIACTLRAMGRLDEACAHMCDSIPQSLALFEPVNLIVLAEDLAAVLAEMQDYGRSASLLGAAEAMRARERTPRDPNQESELRDAIATARASVLEEVWNSHYHRGWERTVEDVLMEAHAALRP